MSSVRRAWWGTLAVCVVVGVLATLVPSLRVAAESMRARAALETGQSLVGLLAGLLIVGRYTRSRRHADLLIAYALFLGSSATLLIELVAAPDPGEASQAFRTWTGVLSRSISALALLWAALAPGLELRRADQRPMLRVWSAVVLTLVPLGLLCWILRSWLPADPADVFVGDRLDPALAASAVGAVLIASLLAISSTGFLRQAEETKEPLTTALALGTLLGSASWSLFVVFPTVFADVVHLGDLLRFAFYVVLAVGAEREIHAYWSRMVRATASEERRRMARDLHDGLAQELAFLVRHTRLLARGAAPPGTEEMLISASDRALDEARRAISTLTARTDEPLSSAIVAAAEEVAARVDTRVHVDVDPELALAPLEREAVIRIIREAVGNAGRHGGATMVHVRLDGDGLLRVTDDGRGFDTAAPTPTGRFGLTSMRERAEMVGATLVVASAPGSGVTVELRLP